MPNPGQAGADFPDPTGQKPSGISDSAWRSYREVDSSKPLSWWASQDQFLDPSATGYERYKSNKINPETGQPFEGLVEHPDAVPQGWTAWGQNSAKRITDPAVQAMWAQPGQSTPGPTAAPPPPPQWDAQGNFNSSGVGTGDIKTAAPGSLQDQMQQMLANRSGLFGMTNGRTPNGGYAGTMSVDGNGNPLPTAPNINAKALSGGGLLWSENNLGLGSAAPATVKPSQSTTPSAPGSAQQASWAQSAPPTALQQAMTAARATAANPFSSAGGFNPGQGQNMFTPPTLNPVIQHYLSLTGQGQQPQQQFQQQPNLQQSLAQQKQNSYSTQMPARNSPYGAL